MQGIEQLRKLAKQERDAAIHRAREEYRETLRELNAISAALSRAMPRKPYTTKRRPRYSASHKQRGDFSAMTTRAAAESVLCELGPMTLVELVVELQRRGHRAGDAPRRVGHAVEMALRYHAGRFFKDGDGRWVGD